MSQSSTVEPLKVDLLAYHMLTHALITTFHKRLMDITTKRFADEFMLDTASQVVKTLVGESSDPIKEIRSIIEKYGYQIHESHHDDHSSWSIRCPFAERVHPKLTVNDAICPMSLLILGAIRLQQQNSTMTERGMAPDGSQFEIRYKD
jgi:hypothetical protein